MRQLEQPEGELAITGWVDHMFHWPALPWLGHLCSLNGLPTHSIYEAQPQNVPAPASAICKGGVGSSTSLGHGWL